MAKQADAPGLGPGPERGGGSSPLARTTRNATGFGLELRLSGGGDVEPFSGQLGQRVRRHRLEMREVLSRYGLSNARVFGSVARGDETIKSDVDLLVDVPPGVGLVTLGRCQADLERLLDGPVDLVPASDLKPQLIAEVMAEAVVV